MSTPNIPSRNVIERRDGVALPTVSGARAVGRQPT
jgi:hypothetical protein